MYNVHFLILNISTIKCKRVGLVFLRFRRLPQDGTTMQKHVAVDTHQLHCIIYILLYFECICWLIYWTHSTLQTTYNVPHNCRNSVESPSIYRAYNRIATAKWGPARICHNPSQILRHKLSPGSRQSLGRWKLAMYMTKLHDLLARNWGCSEQNRTEFRCAARHSTDRMSGGGGAYSRSEMETLQLTVEATGAAHWPIMWHPDTNKWHWLRTKETQHLCSWRKSNPRRPSLGSHHTASATQVTSMPHLNT